MDHYPKEYVPQLRKGKNLVVRKTLGSIQKVAQIESASQTVAGILHALHQIPLSVVGSRLRWRNNADASLAEFLCKPLGVLLSHSVKIHPQDDLLDGLQQGQKTNWKRGGTVRQ